MGMMAGQMRAAMGGGALWTPLNMATVPQIYLDAQDSTITIILDACSALGNLGAMGSAGDFSQSTNTKRPAVLTAELNSNRVLRFDGVNDVLTGSTAAQKDIFRNKPAAWCFSVHKKRTTDGTPTIRSIFAAGDGASATAVRIATYAGFSTAGLANTPRLLGKRLDEDSYGVINAPSAYSGSYIMNLNAIDYATRLGQIHVNGAMVVENTTLTTAGNSSDTSAIAGMTIGAFVNESSPADIDVAAIIVSNAYPSAGDIDKLFGWAAHKYGLTANLPGGHPYKTVAPTV